MGHPDHGTLSDRNNFLLDPLSHLSGWNYRDTSGLEFYNVDDKPIFDEEPNDSSESKEEVQLINFVTQEDEFIPLNYLLWG